MIRLPILMALMLVLIGCTNGQQEEQVEALLDSIDGAAPVNAVIERDVALVKNNPDVLRAFDYVEAIDSESLEELIYLTEIPAPPFKEQQRADAFLDMLIEAGVDSSWIDEEGNAVALKKGSLGDRTVAIAAHLDTVFPEETPINVQIRGDTLFAPGIGDDTRGLIDVLTLLKAINYAGIQTEADLLFIGTVGEEGLGDLRGVKYLFGPSGPRIDAWIAIDGGKLGNIVYKGLGSHRYRVTFEGPGGHSWGAFGTVNPHHALGTAVSRFIEKASEYTRSGPRTSYSVGRIGGGTSVNAIPSSSWLEVDIRSVDPERLGVMDSLLYQAVYEAVEMQNGKRKGGPALTVAIDMIGNRPSGALEPTVPLIQRAAIASVLMGFEPTYSLSSTDSNIPISLGIPSITIGRAGTGGGAHSLQEWWMNDRAYMGVQWALLIAVAEAGLG